MAQSDFYTMRGYSRREQPLLSHAMEDYLEMICRQAEGGRPVRVGQLAGLLNVRPSSASKMAARLRDAGMLAFEPYGYITLTGPGAREGAWLMRRHAVLQRFFCRLNGSDDELELVEKIEHFIDRRTVESMERWLARPEE